MSLSVIGFLPVLAMLLVLQLARNELSTCNYYSKYLELLYVFAGEPCRETGKLPGVSRLGGSRDVFFGDALTEIGIPGEEGATFCGGSRVFKDSSFLADSDMVGGSLSSARFHSSSRSA